jgi:hypothetical protein
MIMFFSLPLGKRNAMLRARHGAACHEGNIATIAFHPR